MKQAQTKKRMDLLTLLLLLGMYLGLIGNLCLTLVGAVPLLLAPFFSVLFLNCSFTVWHEAIHGTVSKHPSLNHAVGFLGAWISMLPYFMLRTIHAHHHRFTNDPLRDPDYWFIDGPFWKLPLRYPAGMSSARRFYNATKPDSMLKLLDLLGQLGLLACFALGWFLGILPILIGVWLGPKIITMFIHAWYVNYLPHYGCPTERFRSTRVIRLAAWLQPFVLFHNYHGLHHTYPTIPWHSYRSAFQKKQRFFAAHNMPIATIRQALLT